MIAHREVAEKLTRCCCRIVELKIADVILKCARAFMEENVLHDIGLNVLHIKCIHINYSSEGSLQK